MQSNRMKARFAAGTRASGYGYRGSMGGFTEAANRETLAKIVAAGRTPGMPATADAVQVALARGVRYIYTHLPTVLGAGAKAYFRNACEVVAAAAK